MRFTTGCGYAATLTGHQSSHLHMLPLMVYIYNLCGGLNRVCECGLNITIVRLCMCVCY